MKVGIFGGTFDPFTKAHAAIVRKVLDEKLVDHVAVVPSVVDYYRNKEDTWLDHEDRVKVIQRMLADEIAANEVTVDVNEYDRFKECVTETQTSLFVNGRRFIHTLADLLGGDYREHELYLIIGSDQFAKFATWFRWEEILKHVKLIVVTGRNGRPDLPITTVPASSIGATVSIGSEYAHVSATAVRRAYRGTLDPVGRYMLGLPPTTTETKDMLLHTPIFDVVQGPEVQPGFRPVQLKAPDWVMVIAEKGGKFMTVTQLRYGNMKDTREFVCGQVEPGEDPKCAAARELREETGISVRNWPAHLTLLGTVNPNPAIFSNHAWFYYVDLDKAEHTELGQALDEHERITVGWLDKEEILGETIPRTYGPDTPALYLCALRMYENHKLREKLSK